MLWLVKDVRYENMYVNESTSNNRQLSDGYIPVKCEMKVK